MCGMLGQVWMGHMYSLSKSEGEDGGTQETQTGLTRFFEKTRRGKKNGLGRQEEAMCLGQGQGRKK